MTSKQLEVTLWELAGADPHCMFSPFVWRVRLILAHKGLAYKSIPWRYTEKDLIKPAEKVRSVQLRAAACAAYAAGNTQTRC